MTEFYTYDTGTDPIAACGAMRAAFDNVLCRAILSQTAISARSGLVVPVFNSSDAECFEIVNVGPAARTYFEKNNEPIPKPGEHWCIKSTAADRVSQADKAGMFWCVPVQDLATRWLPVRADNPALVAFIAAKRENAGWIMMAAPSEAPPTIEPAR